MRYAIRSFALAAACGLAVATIAAAPASAELRRVGDQSASSLRAACAGAGGSYGSNSLGEHWCEKGGNLVDCNYKNRCIGGTPRTGGGSTSVTGGAGGTKASAYLGPPTRVSGQGTRPVTDLSPAMARHHR